MVIINKTIKQIVYGKGTNEQIDFLAKLGGMNEEETNVFKMLHNGESDIYIMMKTNLSNRSYAKVEQNVRSKLAIAIFTCINKTIDLEKPKICSISDTD